jgi:hypothetical protein
MLWSAMSWFWIVQHGIWILAVLLDLALLVLLARQQRARDFPVFFTFLFASIFTFSVTWLAAKLPGTTYARYFYTSWTMAAINILLAFAVLHEVFRHVFGPFEGLRRTWTIGFRVGACILLGIAILAAKAAPGSNPVRVVAGVLLLERSLRIVQLGLVAILLVLARYLRLPLPNPAFGIALGFGVYAAVTLAGTAILSEIPYSAASQMVALAKPTAYNCAAVLWLACVSGPLKQPNLFPVVPADELRRWNDALLQFLHR